MKLKIGIDVDYTITSFPLFFSLLTQRLFNDCQIFIITSYDRIVGNLRQNFLYRLKQLKELDIKFHFLILAKGENLEELGKDKARICKDYGIDIMFDDDNVFVSHLVKEVNVFHIMQRGRG